MTEMTINGVDIATYNARLLNYSVSGTQISNTTSQCTSQLLMPTLYHCQLSPRTLTIALTFFPKFAGETAKNTSVFQRFSRATDNITRFEADIIGKVVDIGLPDGYIYRSIVTALPAAEFDISGEHDVTYTFMAIRQLAEQSEKIVNGKINCLSTTKTACKIILTVPTAYSTLTICNVTINNISANSEIVIDSEKGLITADGRNKFNDTDFVEFPALMPGYNTIPCSVSDADITVIYTPIFV